MSSTIYRAEHLAPVISLDAARAGRRGGAAAGDTLMVRCSLVSDDAVYRWVGIHEGTTIAECCGTVATVFGIDGQVGAEADPGLVLGRVLPAAGATTSFRWGLWRIEMQLADVYPRDESTPPSVCVAGSGEFGERPFDIAAVNARLLGSERATQLELLLRGDVRDVVGRAASHDFLPLIQALGVERSVERSAEASTSADAPARLADLPLERDPRSRDAFWACVLADACFADDATTRRLTESIMRSLGWGDLDAEEIRSLCVASLVELAGLAAGLPLARRLDLYRDLLRG